MRNVWFHRQIAEYISTARDIDPKTVVAQRDFAFSMSDEEMERQAKRSAELRRLAELKRSIKPKIKLLSVCKLFLNIHSEQSPSHPLQPR